MRVARWRWVLLPMVVLIAGCLPQPASVLPLTFVSKYDGIDLPTFTMQTPPTVESEQEVIAALRASQMTPMFQGRAVPIFGVMDCRGVPQCTHNAGGPRTVWVVVFPDCTNRGGDVGWAVVDTVKGLGGGSIWDGPCVP